MKNTLSKSQGLSDRALTWLFVTPTILLLLAVNIYPLIYAISMSFTNFYANKPGREIKFIGLKNYIRILNKEDIWETMQAFHVLDLTSSSNHWTWTGITSKKKF